MDLGIISARYARALLAFAKDRGEETAVYEDMKMLAVSFASEPTLKEVLSNPVVPTGAKRKLIVSAAGIEVSGAFDRFVGLVLQRKRESVLPIMCWSYLSLYRKEKRIDRLYLYSAVPLTQEEKDRLIDETKGKTGGTVEVSEQVRPELIGGLVLRMNNYRYDASVASQLKKVRKQLAGEND